MDHVVAGPKRASVVEKIKERFDDLRPSEKHVARVVLEDPEATIRMSISALAAKAGVSDPTVLRFARRLDMRGFTDLKIAIATDFAAGTPYVDREVEMADTPEVVADKLLGSAMRQLTAFKGDLDYDAIRRAAKAIQAARRIDICGIAQSNFAAAEVQHRLARMGFCAISMPDTHMQMQSAASLGPADVVLLISFAGQVRDTVEVAKIARRVGAKVIVISRSGSALAKSADILINVDTDEKTFIYTSSATRLAHLLATDILMAVIALDAGPSMIETLRRSRLATNGYWIPEDER